GGDNSGHYGFRAVRSLLDAVNEVKRYLFALIVGCLMLNVKYPLQTTSATVTSSKLTSPKASALRTPAIRVPPPQIKTSGLNNNEQSRPSSRSSSLASSGTFTSAPSTTSTAPSISGSSTENQKMLKIKFFSGNKDKGKTQATMGTSGIAATSAGRGTMAEMRNSKLAANQNNDETGKISGLVKPKNNSMKVSRKIPATAPVLLAAPRDTMMKGTGSRASGLPLQSSSSSSSCSNTTLQGVKRAASRAPQSSATQLRQPANLDPTKNKRFSKSSEEDSAYAGFGSSSPISSAESSSMSLNSTSSKNSSCSAVAANHPRARTLSALTFQHSATANHRFISGTVQPPSSPHEAKPTLAVKGISAPKITRLAPPSNKYTSPTVTIPRNSPTSGESSPSKGLLSGPDSGSKSEVTATVITSNASVAGNATSTLIASKTAKSSVPSQSPTVGIVSPMMSHRTIKLPQTSSSIADGSSQSDASTTSGSRDSDNVSVIYNPEIEEANSLSHNSTTKAVVAEKKPPPLPPARTNSHLETAFDSNCGVATSEITTTTSKSNISTFSGSDLEGIRPMEPIVPLVPPPYNVVRNGKTYRQNVSARNGSLRDSSTSDDSIDSISTTIRCGAPHRPSGYLSEGESLFTANVAIPELSMAGK
ncbi:unnamed protein product, partial [Litomosoides sigmodontis]